MRAARFSSPMNPRCTVGGISAALALLCITNPACAQNFVLATGVEALWKNAAPLLLGPSTSGASSGTAEKKSRRASPKKARARRKKLAQKRTVATRKRLESRKRTAARQKASKRNKGFKGTHHIKDGVALSVPLPRQKMLAGASSQTNAPGKIGEPSVDRTLLTERKEIGKRRSDELDCKRFIPTANMNISVPCPF